MSFLDKKEPTFTDWPPDEKTSCPWLLFWFLSVMRSQYGWKCQLLLVPLAVILSTVKLLGRSKIISFDCSFLEHARKARYRTTNSIQKNPEIGHAPAKENIVEPKKKITPAAPSRIFAAGFSRDRFGVRTASNNRGPVGKGGLMGSKKSVLPFGLVRCVDFT